MNHNFHRTNGIVKGKYNTKYSSATVLRYKSYLIICFAVTEKQFDSQVETNCICMFRWRTNLSRRMQIGVGKSEWSVIGKNEENWNGLNWWMAYWKHWIYSDWSKTPELCCAIVLSVKNEETIRYIIICYWYKSLFIICMYATNINI